MEDSLCSGKKSYTKRGALSACKKRYKESHVQLRVYACNKGDHWHLTHQLTFDRKKEYKLKPIVKKRRVMFEEED